MTEFEVISVICAAISAAAAVAGFRGLREQLEHSEQTATAERERARKRATLEHVTEQFFEVRDLRERLRELLRSDADPEENCKKINAADDARSTEAHGTSVPSDLGLGDAARRYLTYLEFIAIGVKSDILDESVVKAMSRGHFLRVREKLGAYISAAQNKRKHSDSPYETFTSLVDEWKKDIATKG